MDNASWDFDIAMQRLRQTAFKHGEFLLYPSESINVVVTREQVSKGYGVYVISEHHGQGQDVLYIGKSGTICQDGSTKEQGILKRLTMKQDGMYRREFFPKVISERNLDALHFEWFETYAEGQGLPPFLAEAELLAAFLRSQGRLPALNSSA